MKKVSVNQIVLGFVVVGVAAVFVPIASAKMARPLPTCTGTWIATYQIYSVADGTCPNGYRRWKQAERDYGPLENGGGLWVVDPQTPQDMGCKAGYIPQDVSTCQP